MKKQINNQKSHASILIGIALLVVVLITGALPGITLAIEEIGNLVFKAMDQMNAKQEEYATNLGPIREKQSQAVSRQEAYIEKFEHAKTALDRRELHAEIFLGQAEIYDAISDEVVLTSNITQKQHEIVCDLIDKLKSGNGVITAQETEKIIQSAEPMLDNGIALLDSLMVYRDKIADPEINQKLNYAVETASVLKMYVESLRDGNDINGTSQQELINRVESLKDQLTALYVQTDIVKDMLIDRNNRLKILNEIAIIETSIMTVTGSAENVEANLRMVELNMINPLLKSDQVLDRFGKSMNQIKMERSGSIQRVNQSWTRGIR